MWKRVKKQHKLELEEAEDYKIHPFPLLNTFSLAARKSYPFLQSALSFFVDGSLRI